MFLKENDSTLSLRARSQLCETIMKFLTPSFPAPAYKTARTNWTTSQPEGGWQDAAFAESAPGSLEWYPLLPAASMITSGDVNAEGWLRLVGDAE